MRRSRRVISACRRPKDGPCLDGCMARTQRAPRRAQIFRGNASRAGKPIWNGRIESGRKLGTGTPLLDRGIRACEWTLAASGPAPRLSLPGRELGYTLQQPTRNMPPRQCLSPDPIPWSALAPKEFGLQASTVHRLWRREPDRRSDDGKARSLLDPTARYRGGSRWSWTSQLSNQVETRLCQFLPPAVRRKPGLFMRGASVATL